ncbi:DUF998 domain-containing protein [Microbispora sp. GKU 823]|uniref:DUF998 domain-containing protein n=1 Tax=Microbispora sp. GKU 823 TaxID=1652100 RepID=UPI0009D567D3|nr:DUF998 domain-containing protein [Microbispora sp. GKU 823]OPG11424.1 hypothetical protein B1L11_20525 [Microbispora sp. GKU 823]
MDAIAESRRARPATLLCGAVSGPLFLGVILVEGAARSGYDPFRHPGSALSLGDRGWIQIANFLLTGLSLLGFAAAVRTVLRSPVGALLVGVAGLAMVVSGLFTMDPMRGYPPGSSDPITTSWHHQAHDVAGVVLFLALPAACFPISRRLGSGWRAYLLLTAAAGLVLMVWFGTAWEAGAANAGLIQRILIAVDLGWISLLAVHLLAFGVSREAGEPS